MGNQKNNIRVSHRGHVSINGGAMKRNVNIGFQRRNGVDNRIYHEPTNMQGPIAATVTTYNPITGGTLHTIKFNDSIPKKKNIKLNF